MNSRMAALCSIATALALSACASTSGTAPTKSVAAVPPAGCVSGTGSGMTASSNCAEFGHTYTREDIEHTGRTTAAGALRDLDPTLTIGR